MELTNHNFVLFNAGDQGGFYHVEYDTEGKKVHVSGTLPTLVDAIGQAVAAGADIKEGPLTYKSHRHDREEPI